VFNTKVEGHGIADLLYKKLGNTNLSLYNSQPSILTLKVWKVSYGTFVRGDHFFGWLGGFCSMTVPIRRTALAVTLCLTPRKTNSYVK
jgi:hypothetical protein